MESSKRRSRDAILMDCAYVFSTRSTCQRNGSTSSKVGAVIAIDGRIISTGYNGTPSGLDHCDHTCDCSTVGPTGKRIIRTNSSQHEHDCPSIAVCRLTVHAEANAVAFAARCGTATQGATIYTTMSPCYDCAKLIVNAGLVRCVYGTSYRDTSGLDLLLRANVQVQTVET